MVARHCTGIARPARGRKPKAADGLPPASGPGVHSAAQEPLLSWEEALRLYHDYQQAKRAAHRTIYAHERALKKLQDALVADAPRPGDVKLDHLRRYQLALLRRRLSAATVANVTGHLRSFFRFLFLDEHLPQDPAARLEPPKVPRRLPGEVLTPKEIQRLLAACGEVPTPLLSRAVVEVLYATGVRRAELLALDLSDVDHRQRTVFVRAGKGEQPRLLPLAPTCYQALLRYLELARPELEREPTSALFLSTRGQRLSKDSLARLLHELSRVAGLAKRVTPHCFRRTCATGLLSNGTNLKVIQTILGHQSLETTSVYLNLSPEEIRSEVLTRHPRERFEA